MKAHYLKTGTLIFLFCQALFTMAQPSVFKTLNEELMAMQKQLVPDKRLAIFEIEIKDTLKPVIVVFGETDLPEAKTEIRRVMDKHKIDYIDSVRLLPDAAVGNKTWGLVTISVSNLRGKPENAAELVSQVLMGMPVKILDVNRDWYRVQTPEKYIGWMEGSGIQLETADDLGKWKQSERWVFSRTSGNLLKTEGKKGEIVSDLVLGNLFELVSEKKGFIEVKLPDGRTGFVKKKHCISYKKWSKKVPEIEPVIAAAEKMMGSPYLWGGTSTKAADCSGFVKTAYYSQGVILARDASQQARYGEKIDVTNPGNLQRGDLLFFGRSAQRITHVGLYLGNGDFIHSSGRVHISSIDPRDPKFVSSRNLVAACRIVNSINSDGIVAVKDHPWYNSLPDNNSK